MEKLEKLIFALPFGFLSQYVSLFWLIVTGLLFITADIVTALLLARRLKKSSLSSGKFKSENAKKCFSTIMYLFMMVVLAYMLEVHVLNMLGTLHLANYVTGIFCVVQGVSILENVSSHNNESWAKVLQKVLMDKAERHYDINLKDIENDKEQS